MKGVYIIGTIKVLLVIDSDLIIKLFHLPKENQFCNFLCITIQLPRKYGISWKIF